MIAALSLGVFTVTTAQEQTKDQEGKITAEQRAERHADRLQKALQLTDAQRQSIVELDLNAAKQMQAAGADARAGFKEIQKNKDEKMKSILTREQYQKYMEMRSERRGNMAGHRDEQ